MTIVPPPAGYGPAVRASLLWAAGTSMLAVALALVPLLSGSWLLAQSLMMPLSVGEVAAGLLLSSLGGLFLYGILRCVVLCTAAVWRSPGYPERHWWFVRRAFRSMLRTELVLLAAGVGLTAFAVFGRGRLAEPAAVAAAVVDGGFLFLPLLDLLGMNGVLRHAAVVPYFPREVGEISTFGNGEGLARHVAELDEFAVGLGLTPLSAFGWNDDMEREPLVWHGASEGLKTVNALLASLEREEVAWDDHAGTVADLKRIAHALARADARGIPFSLLLRHATATNAMEWEARRGTCF
jgi:hypothetical protein